MKTRYARTCYSLRTVSPAIGLLLGSVALGQNLFEADRTTGNVYEFTPAGARSSFATGFSIPFGLAFDTAGNLFVGDASGSITRITPVGMRSTFASGLNGPTGMTFDSAGNLYVAQGGFQNANVLKITPDGTKSVYATGMVDPWSLAFDSAGNLFVSNIGSGSGAGFITRVTPTGTQSTFASGLSLPDGLAFDGAGNLFVSGGGDNGPFSSYIIKFTPDGQRSTFASPTISGAVQSSFDSEGNLFLTSGGANGAIYEFAPSGHQSTFASGLQGPAGLAFQPVPEPSAFAVLCVGAVVLLDPWDFDLMHPDTAKYNKTVPSADRDICDLLAREIDRNLSESENKIWHAQPVWFLDGNPIVGYSKLKDCVRLLFWSGQSFEEDGLKKEGSFKAAEVRYTAADQVNREDLKRWLTKAREIQWDYKNIVRRKGQLEWLKRGPAISLLCTANPKNCMGQLFRLSGTVKRAPAIEKWLQQHTDELGQIAKHWFEVMRDCGDDVREVLHDGYPTACIADAAFAYVGAFKAHVNIGFFRGAELPDPRGLLEGTGRMMRHVKLGPGRKLDAEALAKLVDAAYTDMKNRVRAHTLQASSNSP